MENLPDESELRTVALPKDNRVICMPDSGALDWFTIIPEIFIWEKLGSVNSRNSDKKCRCLSIKRGIIVNMQPVLKISLIGKEFVKLMSETLAVVR